LKFVSRARFVLRISDLFTLPLLNITHDHLADMKIIPCPINGPRPVQEFHFGGELRDMPDPGGATDEQWADYVFNRQGEPANGGTTFPAAPGSSPSGTTERTRSTAPICIVQG